MSLQKGVCYSMFPSIANDAEWNLSSLCWHYRLLITHSFVWFILSQYRHRIQRKYKWLKLLKDLTIHYIFRIRLVLRICDKNIFSLCLVTHSHDRVWSSAVQRLGSSLWRGCGELDLSHRYVPARLKLLLKTTDQNRIIFKTVWPIKM